MRPRPYFLIATALVCCLLSVACRDRTARTSGPAQPIPDGFVDAVEDFEASFFAAIEARNGGKKAAGSISEDFAQHARGVTRYGRPIDLGQTDPRARVKTLIAKTVEFAGNHDMSVLHKGLVYSFFGKDPNLSLGNMPFRISQVSVQNTPNVYAESGGDSSFTVSGDTRYANVMIAFGHHENMTLRYTCHLFYDMKEDQLCLTTFLYYAEPAPRLPRPAMFANPAIQ